jgi:hypothetical protein
MIKHIWAITIIIGVVFLSADRADKNPAANYRIGFSAYFNREYTYVDKDGLTYVFDSSDVRKGDNFKFIQFMTTKDPSVFYEWTYSLERRDSGDIVTHPVITNFKVKLQTFNQ